MHRARVAVGARLHFGFQNLSLSHERLYGGLGVGLAAPRVVVEAEPADAVRAPDAVEAYARTAAELLGVPGAEVTVVEELPRHVGLGSGTRLALATLAAVAHAHGRDPRVRTRAPDLGRGGRSGVGVATFEAGGFVVDGGHPTELFTTDRPPTGEWTVPPVVARHDLPADWRVVLAVPDAPPGKDGDDEDESIRHVVERADPAVADQVSTVVTRRLLPAAADGDLATFGAAVSEIERLNGAWYADEQGGVFRPPAGELVGRLGDEAAVAGVGQSSWGPAVYALTDADRVSEVRRAAAAAVEGVGDGDGDGDVVVSRLADAGASVSTVEASADVRGVG